MTIFRFLARLFSGRKKPEPVARFEDTQDSAQVINMPRRETLVRREVQPEIPVPEVSETDSDTAWAKFN
jgi:hypothetical protein